MWGKYFILRGIADALSTRHKGDDGWGCWTILGGVFVISAVLALLLPLAILAGCGFLLYRFVIKLETSAAFRRGVLRVLFCLICLIGVACLIGITRSIVHLFL